MNVKIQGSGNGTYANTGSCVAVTNYLQHEDLERMKKGEFPALHEKVTYGRYEFEVLEMDNRRILKVKFTVNAPAEPNSSSL